MRFFFLLFISFLVSYNSFSQEDQIIFGKPNTDELSMMYYSKDSSAEAVILYDREDIRFITQHRGYYAIEIDCHVRIKILKKSGLDKGIIKIRYSESLDGNETIDDLEGYTFNNENGTIVTTKLTKESVFKEKIIDGEFQKKITMPNVKEGSVIEYKYTRRTPFNIRRKPNSWYFQGDVPIKWSEISMIIPNRFYYKIFREGYLPFHINEKKDTVSEIAGNYVTSMKYRYVVKDAPAFRNEPYITSYKDYIARLEFELAAYTPEGGAEINFNETWKDINKSLIDADNFGKRLNKTNFLKEAAAGFESITDTLEKVKAAFEFISKRMKWDTYLRVYVAENLSDVFENKTGSSAEINLILVALLRKLGIEANPVIISTRGNGNIDEAFPMLGKFNSTIAQAKVGGKDILMDATEPFSKPNMLPYRCLNKKGLIIEKDNGRFVSLQPTEKRVELEVIDFIIKPEASEITGKYSSTIGGYKAFERRNYISKEGEAEDIKAVRRNHPDWQLDNIKVENKDQVYESLKTTFDFTSNDDIKTPDIIYFNPMSSDRISENPFKTADRIYPVDFVTASERIFMATVKIPDGYKIDEMPKSNVYTLPDKAGKFSYVIEVENNVVKIRSQLSISKNYFSPAEYPHLRELYNIVIQKQGQQIVFKKSK